MRPPKKRLFGLVGYPLTHSFSESYFTKKISEAGWQDTCAYRLFPLKNILEITDLVVKYPSLEGFNVTIPYKEKIIDFLDELNPLAEAVGAVNTVRITRNRLGEIILMKGYNTDVYGFQQSIKPFLEPHHQRALILGTGGAAKAVAVVLKQLGIDYYFVSRNKNKLTTAHAFDYPELNEHVLKAFTLIVNATPVGMFPDSAAIPPIPVELLTPQHLVIDLVYNPEKTRLLQSASQQGALTLNGLSMLYLQADKAWEIWNT
jgi:shikimate dehydrogenase